MFPQKKYIQYYKNLCNLKQTKHRDLTFVFILKVHSIYCYIALQVCLLLIY